MSTPQFDRPLGQVNIAQMKWDYMVVPVPSPRTSRVTTMSQFDQLGYQGWELVQIFEGNAYFKRLGEHRVEPPSGGST